ncbi:MAG: fibronectin type III domain-containing protein [Candidatus Electryonea clarkiae]|nr:fibronectin type III domain-containing protein [Candidatus Electryonea clarkiae]MDP8286824.1 fibronectin type III domain-containing protein [Candidatus Electryonea clarkiae]
MYRFTVLFLLIAFFVFAGCEKDEDSSSSTTSPSTLVPDTPTDLMVSEVLNRSITLTWHDNADNEDYYHLERSIDSHDGFVEKARMGANSQTFTDTDLAPGISYFYRVRASNSTGFSDYSDETHAWAKGTVENPELRIADGAATTPTRYVSLVIVASNVPSMLISNNYYFIGAEWEPFNPLKSWLLEPGDGMKAVYLKLASGDGDTTDTIFDSIMPEEPDVHVLLNDGARSTNSRDINVKLVTTGSPLRMAVGSVDSDGMRQRWQEFEDEFSWELTPGPGTKPVYVTVQNDFMLEASTTVSIEPEPPQLSISINDGAHGTHSKYVTLTLEASEGVTEMQISNEAFGEGLYSKKKKDFGLFKSVKGNSSELDETDEWVPFWGRTAWELPVDVGTKTVHARIRNEFLLETEAEDAIEPLRLGLPSIEIAEQYEGRELFGTLRLHCTNAESMMVWSAVGSSGTRVAFIEHLNNWQLYWSDRWGPWDPPWPQPRPTLFTVYARFWNSFYGSTIVVSDQVPAAGIFFHTGKPASIILTSNKNELQAGGHHATITATLRDANDDLVENETQVFFLIDGFPEEDRPLLNESDGLEPGNPYEGPFDSTQTNNGSCRVSITSGTSTGSVRLVAWTHVYPELVGTPDADSIITYYNSLMIVGGMPTTMSIDVDEQGTDGGGDIWLLDVTALLHDENGNPARDSIAVQFTLDPPIAEIDFGWTENGIASTTLAYHSYVTNDSVTIEAMAYSDGDEPLTAVYHDFNLPMQEGAALLYCDPTNWNFATQPPVAYFDISVFVYDGHDHCINDQLVRFLTSRGLIWWSGGGQIRNEAMTGPRDYPVGLDGDGPGWAHRYLRITFNDAFPDDREHESTAIASVDIIGYQDINVEPVTVRLQQ